MVLVSHKSNIGNKQKGKFFGFDAWALKQKDFFLSLEEPVRKHLKLADDALITLFGEWCGPAVQKGKKTSANFLFFWI